MQQLLDFAKIEATGNDFIMIDGRTVKKGVINSMLISRLCDRHFGIGADGLIRLGYTTGQQLAMQYYNSDGSEARMCGNGLRAFMLYGFILGLIPRNEICRVSASDGMHHCIIKSPELIKVEIFARAEIQMSLNELAAPRTLRILGSQNTGVPHLVLEVKGDLDKINVTELGRRLRNHPAFSPDGTNVNFVKRHSNSHLQVRTYERGVEGETLSCGSGVTASAVVCWNYYNDPADAYLVDTKGGRLTALREGGRYYLQGAAHAAFVGRAMHPDSLND
jgi:diaminopimelate epimerase